MAHCRSISAHPDGQRVAILQVKARPGGVNNQNGRGKDVKEDSYLGLMSVITLWELREI